jgi:hypothetical protein
MAVMMPGQQGDLIRCFRRQIGINLALIRKIIG